MMEKIAIDKIRRDGGTQIRVALDENTLKDYGDSMLDGANFPPVEIFYDGADYWLGDGFHRVVASEMAGFKDIFANVRPGTRRDAILHGVGANSQHGLRRTNADKRRAVRVLLADPEWARWSDREIARRAAVSTPTVSVLRENLTVKVLQSRKGADGRTINVANIGKTKKTTVTEEIVEEEETKEPEEEIEIPLFNQPADVPIIEDDIDEAEDFGQENFDFEEQFAELLEIIHECTSHWPEDALRKLPELLFSVKFA